jgi:hypothetical protein
MVAFLSWGEVAKVLGGLAAALAVVFGVARLLGPLRDHPRSPVRRRKPLPRTVDQAAAEQRDAANLFRDSVIRIASAVETFDPWQRPGFDDDLKTIRELKQTLDSIGTGSVQQAFGKGSAVAQIERETRYAVIRTIEILDGYRNAAAPSDDRRHEARWLVVEEPRMVLEHARDLFDTNTRAAQEQPLQPPGEVVDSLLWDELRQFAAPAHGR